MARKKRKAASADEAAAAVVAESEEAGPNGIGHNSELTDEQRQALFFQHKKTYQAALAVKKAADAEFKNVAKRAKAELGDDAVASIKDAILLESDDGEMKIRETIERQMRVARWMNVPFGAQAELFTDFTDPRPATERAHAEGKKAGMEGVACDPPYDQTVPQHDEWIAGWQAGQQAIFAIQRSDDGALFDAAEAAAADPQNDAVGAPIPA